MARKPSAEQFAQRAYDLGLLTERQLQAIWGEFRRRDIPLEEFQAVALRKNLLTNYQFERIERGEHSGFFYGDYRTLYFVGSGSFARVYRAAHRETGEIRAVKVLRTRFRDDEITRDQFLREGKMGMTLRHDNIVPIYEVHSEAKNPFLVMEFVEGYSLREFVKIRKRLEPVEATRLLRDLMAGLDYAFKKGITHRDLKMSNVLVASTGTAKLVDFGLAAATARLSDEELANLPNPRTIDYAGLERATGVKKDDLRSDIFFAGVIYYHMLAGVSPLHETKDRIQRLSITRFQGVTPIIQLAPTLPRQVVQMVSRAMELNPSRRYESPAAMLADIEAALKKLEAGESLEDGQPAASVQQQPAEETPTSAAPATDRRRSVMVVESNPQLQDALRNGLKEAGYRVLVIGDVDRALSRFEEGADLTPADCVVFSTNSLGAAAVAGFNRLGAVRHTHATPCILLVDKRHAQAAAKADTEDHRITLKMPVAFSHFRDEIARLIELRSLN